MNADPLNRPADRATLDRLLDAGLLTPEAREEAVAWVEPRRDWWTWSDRSLLFVGSALALAGIVFFFAYNWAEMGPFLKLGLAEGVVVACLLGVLWRGLDRLGGKVFLFGASFLAGVFLAVFGQVYQTGADAWELFAGWAALIVGWVLLSRFAALWILWLAVVNTGVILYQDQMAVQASTMWLVLAGINLAVLAALEFAAARKAAWVQPQWTRPLLWGSSLVYLTIPVLWMIVAYRGFSIPALAAVPLLLGCYAAALTFYVRRVPDLRAVAVAALSFCSVIVALVGKWVFDVSEAAGAFLLMGMVTLGVFSGAVVGLRALGRRMKEDAHA